MNERGLVEVPENAVRDEPIAFGLTGAQLGIFGAAVPVAAVLNLLPFWVPLRGPLIVVGRGPIVLGGDPADPRRTGLSLAHPAPVRYLPQPANVGRPARRRRCGDPAHRKCA